MTISLRDGAKDRNPHSLSCGHVTLTHTHTHTHTHTLSLSLSLSLTHTNTHTLALPSSHCGPIARKHTHPLSHSHTDTHKHTHTHALSHLMLSPGCRHKPCFRRRSPTTRLRLLPVTILHEAKMVSQFRIFGNRVKYA